MFAWFIQKEVPSVWTALCCVGLLVGTALVSWDFALKMDSSIPGLIFNLGSAIASGLMIVVIRRACIILREQDPTISILEITLIKVAIATLITVIPALWIETGAFAALKESSTDLKLLVAGGVVITMLYQSITCGLAAFSLATTVGILSQSKM
jgi:drug/metabolite transporter (DMT)-like permease